MNNNLQKIKINQKINLISELIDSLSKYNNIKGYNNQKKFTIDISYRKELNNQNYYYSINIMRGTNEPKCIFNMRFVSLENIDSILEKLIEKLTQNNSFSYTSFSSNYNGFSSYNIILRNNVEVKFCIKTEEDLDKYKEIEKQFNKKEIIVIPPEKTDKTKDILQEEKMINTVEILHKILNTLEKYNNIEDYDNKKPFNFSIRNYYDKYKECYVFTFTILRGNTKPEIFLTLNASIKTKDLFYDKIFDLIMDFKQKESFLIELTSNIDYKGNYSILTRNNITLEFIFEDELDKKFYTNFIKETSEKRAEFDLSQNKNKLLNPNV